MIDLAEQRALRGAPRLAQPIEAIGQIARDWMLVRSVRGKSHTQFTAMDLQRWYLNRLKKYLEACSDVPAEAWDIIDKWQTTLNQLSVKISNQESIPRMLVGRLDWLSKLWLLLQLDTTTPWPVRKKIDIRYHEMSEQGYHRKLIDMVELAPVVREDEIAVARRSPPPNTSARRRGNLIREFSSGDSELQVEWRQATYRVDGEIYHVDF
jgi:proteasome accessory factor A